MKNSHEDKVLLSEVKRALDKELEALDFPVQSRLTQARFHAIDKGLLSNNFTNRKSYLVQSIAAVCVLAFVVTFGLMLTSNDLDKYNYNISKKDQVSPVLINKGDETVESSEDVREDTEDTKEEIEIYNWLYDHYG